MREKEMIAKKQGEQQTSSGLKISESNINPSVTDTFRLVKKATNRLKTTIPREFKNNTELERDLTVSKLEHKSSEISTNEQILNRDIKKNNETTQTAGENTGIEGSLR